MSHRCLRAFVACGALIALMVGPARAQARLPGPDVASGLAVQFTDNFLKGPDWRSRLDAVASLGATVVRVDINWPWIETQPGRYDWTLYDQYAAALAERRLRPLFILNRPNRLHGQPYEPVIDGKRERWAAAPAAPEEIAGFAQWAAAAAERYRHLDPIWEIWNEPDMAGFWPPKPRPADYVALAREACRAIKARVPDATVVGPAAAEMPTVWRSAKPLIQAVMADATLLACLDAISLHTHRFKQAPETVSRDYMVLRDEYLSAWPAAVPRKPIIDTEWGDSVARDGISEVTQALWLPRMVLTNLMEQVRLTNWYCLMDVGTDDGDLEHRFGLIRYDGSRRPAFEAHRVLARELGRMTLREVMLRFNPRTAEGATVLRFCDDQQRCTLAAWTTEGAREVAIRGWRAVGPAIGHLGEELPPPADADVLRIEVTPAVRYLRVTPRS
jgi:hypothetical protein